MRQSSTTTRSGLFRIAIPVMGLIAIVVVGSQQFRSQANASKTVKNDGVARSHNPAIENYDIRLDKSPEAEGARSLFRQGAARSESDLTFAHKQVERAISDLERRVPDLKIDYSPDLEAPEVIGTDVLRGTFLTEPSEIKHDARVRSFVNQNKSLFGLTSQQVNELKTVADYTNPSGNLSYVILQQQIDGIEVFRGEVEAMITKQGEIARMINNLAPGLDYHAVSKIAGNPADALTAAARTINYQLTSQDLVVESTSTDGRMVTFERGPFADPPTVEKMYFPIESGVARLAWRVSMWEAVSSYYVVVDAETGTMLWRKNTTDDQLQTATYGIYSSDSPSPLSPTNAIPGSGIQGAGVSRTAVTLIGNEAPNSGMNDLGWIPDGSNVTDGNNVEAGLDIVAPDGVDAPVPGNPNRVFDFTYNPPPLGSDVPSGAAYRNGIVTNLFYWTNRYHDFVYGAGFTEAARNFQNNNFGRGGVAADRIRGEAQDSSGTNNANFLTQADGIRGRMQMYLFTGPSPQRDGSLDADVFIHEMTHGTSNRLIGNATGLGNNRGGSMGEGWSDFYARLILSTAGEDVNGVYASGGYVTLNFLTLGTDNYYYGIRRFPYAVKTTLGGPMMRPHNPLTLADIDPAQINTSDGAYPIANWIGNTATEVHNAGEVWCMMLLEVRARIITRLGFAAGNQRMLQITTDGMKVTPTSPNFIQARDAILAADQSGFGGADAADIWAGFATRGAGFGATDGGTAVVQSFNLPNAFVVDPFSVSDAPGDNDGFPEPGENVLLSVAVTNTTGSTVTNVMAAVTGGGTGDYGDIPNGSTVTRQIPYMVPAGAICGSLHQVTITVSSNVGVNSPVIKEFRLGVPVGGAPTTFSNSTLINLPAGQPTTTSGPASPYPSNITVSGLTGNKLITLEITGVTHTFPGDLDYLLVGPGGQKYIFLSDSGSTGDVSNLTFSLNDNAAAQPSTTQWVAGTFKPYNSGADDPFVAPAPAGPYSNAAPAGVATFTSVFGTSGAAMNGVWSLYIVDDATTDVGTQAGWKLTFEANDYDCTLGPTSRPPADFDGDGKTDLSVFRSGTWYIQRSTAGFIGVGFGLGSDVITPGDYDGDGKADIAVFRTNTWYILKSSDGLVLTVPWGASGDLPRAGDYDGDGKTDVAVYRPGSNTYYVRRSSDLGVTAQNWGVAGDVPVVGDFDGDHKTDFGVFRSGTWHILGSTAGYSATPFGIAGDRLVPADYDGDGKTDIAVFRSGTWYLLRSSAGLATVPWGVNSDTTVPGDYDGDGKADVAVFRGSTGTWYIINSGGGSTTTAFGTSGDVAVPSGYIP